MSYSSHNIDDFNTTLIQYNGSWEAVNSSTRQWDGTVHTTGQAGATATFHFKGFQLMVWGTVSAGVGNNSVQLTIDGGSPNITSQPSNGTAIFNFVYFETPLLTETYHTAVVTNLGSTTNGSSVFELDRFSFETSDVTPLFAPPTSQTLSQTQSVPSATASASFAKSSPKSPLGAIAGAVIGTLVLVIILLLFLLWRRRKPKEATGGPTPRLLTPFPLNRPSQTDSSAIFSTLSTQKSQPTPICKEESNVASNPLTTSVSPLSGSQLPQLIIDTSNPQAPSGPIISTSSDPTSSQSLQRDGASIRYLSTDHALNGSSVIRSALSSSVNMYDNPPPSYWRNENDGQSGHRSSGTS